MKKIYTIRNGKWIFISFIILTVLFLLIALIFIPIDIKISLCIGICSIICFIITIVLVKKQYLNYIEISLQGVKFKDKTISWDNIYLTLDYSRPDFLLNAFTYRIFFSDKYYKTDEEIKQASKKGFYINLYQNRLNLLLGNYNKQVHIFKKSPVQKNLYNEIIMHNNSIGY